MATKTIYFYKNVDNITAAWIWTYSSPAESLIFPAIDAVPKTSGDIIIYQDWTRPGYAFMGWDTEEDGTGTRYLPSDSTAIGFASTNYYAQWVSIQPVVTISYNNNVIFEASSTTGTQVLTTQNSFLTDNITVHYAGRGAAIQSVTVTPTTFSQTITPASGYIGLNPVIVEAISPIKMAATYTPTTTNQTIAANQWLDGAQTIKGDANLIPGNIKNGVSIFNVTGTYTGGGGGDFASLVQRTLTSVSDSTITTVGTCAFYTCANLTTASFPNCTSIGASAFAYCYRLNAISFPNCTTINNSAFYSCSQLTTVSFPNCTSIGVSAFYYCYSLTTALFPKCTSVGNYAFCSCYSLATISFPSCTYIGTNAFSRCSQLTTVSLPNCGWLSTAAFHSCINLTTVFLLKCSQIYPSAFAYCYNLLSLYVLTSTVPTLSNINAFVSTPISNYTTSTGGVYGSIFVKESLLASFKITTRWSTYSARMVGLTDAQIAALG